MEMMLVPSNWNQRNRFGLVFLLVNVFLIMFIGGLTMNKLKIKIKLLPSRKFATRLLMNSNSGPATGWTVINGGGC